ncbi:DUF2891 domain-containing protein [Rhizobium oryzicola]|uniref:DUF2891 domain-containing protein n=1 Tax=Rhizobium oryzicola TaxID=1232668 RepID=A0ABT8SUM3_9HYPH|nr:DUF2891 domain-containing protein [Rhizobium oryzicola]MDO1581748.1 DUF2891 domain-containing protein [Rhizobium oryzicola]
MSALGLSADLADRFAAIALGHVTREYPNHLAHGFEGPQDLGTPSQLHPIFYGSFDWHSCVHGYWLLAAILNRFPDGEHAANIRTLFDAQLTPEKVADECAYFARPLSRGYERPYGWGWLLKLSAELHQLEHGRRASILQPLTDVIRDRFMAFLPIATYPVRVGTHFNTAFALRLSADYAEIATDAALMDLLIETADRWYGADENCPAWGEPSSDEFLSSTLIEAECMRRLMPADRFQPWFDRFLPAIGAQQPATLFCPATVSDRSDGKIAHLDGLNLSRAWCFRSLASALPSNDPHCAVLKAAAEDHLATALPHVAGDYMGEHWLASFALLALITQ